jgi:osmotically-inducible protein OsmY
MKMARHGLTWALAAVLAFGSQVVIPQASFAAGQSAQTDNNIQADLQNQLKKFKDVEIKVNNGTVDLEGTVKDFATKEEIDKEAHRVKNVVAVRNSLKVAGAGEMSDAQLQQKIVQKLQYDRVGYGNALTRSV